MTERNDLETLRSLELTDEDLISLGLDRPASGPPDKLCDVYLRRSRRKEDLATLRGHLRDIVRWARGEGLQVRHVWLDQLSASKRHVRRPGFEGAVKAVMDGKSKTLPFWKTDRLDRRGMGEVGQLLDRFDRHGARLVSVTEGLDSSRGGRIVFAVLSERAREEARDISLRVSSSAQERRREGRRGPGLPPYGLRGVAKTGQVEPDPAEYETARRIADRLLKGDSARSVAEALNSEGLTSRTGKPWRTTSIVQMTKSPLWAGMVPQTSRDLDEHGNRLDSWGDLRPYTGPDGEPVMCGQGVVTLSEWYRIQALMRSRSSGKRGKPGHRNLMTSLARCGKCSGPLKRWGPRYTCAMHTEYGQKKCSGMSTDGARLDSAAGMLWISRVSALEITDPTLVTIARRWWAISDPSRGGELPSIRQALEAAQARSQKLEEAFYVYGRISEERYQELDADLSAEIGRLRSRLETLEEVPDITPLLDPEALREEWEEASVPLRRELFQCVYRHIIVQPAKGKGDRTPILDRLIPVPVGEEDSAEEGEKSDSA